MKVKIPHVFEQPLFIAAQDRLDRAMQKLEQLRQEKTAMLAEWKQSSTRCGLNEVDAVLAGKPSAAMVSKNMDRMIELNTTIEILERSETMLRLDVEQARLQCQQLLVEQLQGEFKAIGTRFDACVKQLAAIAAEEHRVRDELRLQGYGQTGAMATRRPWLNRVQLLRDEAGVEAWI
jgi:hypothetical protein